MPRTIVLAGCLLIFATDAVGAQPTGQLAGVVRDTSGGLLPGATVTVTGRIVVAPRTVVTNDRGRYGNVANTEYLTGTSTGGAPAIVGRPGEPRQWGTQFTIRQ